jgi:hypothetical protein
VFDDEFFKNAYYAKLGGVSPSEMNTLEVEFLSLVCSLPPLPPLPPLSSLIHRQVNFNLYVSTETFEKYQQELQSFQIIIPSAALPLSSHVATAPVTVTPLDTTNHLQKKIAGAAESGPPHLTVPDPGERIRDPDPNSISPLKPFDVNNLTLRSLLFNPQHPQSHTTTSLLAAEDSSLAPSSSAWSSSLSSNTFPVFPSAAVASAHDSPRSLTSYRSSDPSPTLTSTRTCQKSEMLQPESRAYAPQPSNSNSSHGYAGGDGECIFTYPMVMAPPLAAQSFPCNSHPCNLAIPHVGSDLHITSGHPLNISVSTQPPLQKYRQCNPSPAVLPTQQKTHPRVYHPPPPPSYVPSRYPPQHAYEGNGGGSGHLQHYDPSSGNGYHPSQSQASSSCFPQHPPITYHPNSCGYFPHHQNTQQPFCPTTNQNYGPSQMQYSAGVGYPPPPQQIQYMGGYYYQPIPSPHVVPGTRYLAPSTTPNSVADIFGGPSGGSKIETKIQQHHHQQQSCVSSSTHKSEEQYLQQRSKTSHSSVHRSAASGGYGGSYSLGVGLQHPYYAWSEQQDHLVSCSNGAGLHLQHPSVPGMVPSLADVNSYPATTLFYPPPLRTVS